MQPGPRKGRPSSAGPKSSQNISTIAHLFFAEQDETEVHSSCVPDRHFMVVGTGLDTCAPYVAAGLGHHFLNQSKMLKERGLEGEGFPLRQVFLGEPSPVRFSGLSYLEAKTYRLPFAEEECPWEKRPRPDRISVLRLFPRAVPSEDFSGGKNDGRFFIRHLDLPRETELLALETQALTGGLDHLATDGETGIVWCMSAQSSTSLPLICRLGRLLRLVEPSVLHAVVFWGQQNGGAKVSPLSNTVKNEALILRSQTLLEYVAGKIPVCFHFMGQSNQDRTLTLGTLARQLVQPLS